MGASTAFLVSTTRCASVASRGWLEGLWSSRKPPSTRYKGKERRGRPLQTPLTAHYHPSLSSRVVSFCEMSVFCWYTRRCSNPSYTQHRYRFMYGVIKCFTVLSTASFFCLMSRSLVTLHVGLSQAVSQSISRLIPTKCIIVHFHRSSSYVEKHG